MTKSDERDSKASPHVGNHQSFKVLVDTFKNSANAVAIVESNDLHGELVYCNTAFTKITGYKNVEAIGMTVNELYGPETNSEHILKLTDSIQRKKSCEVEILCYRKDKQTFWSNVSINPVPTEDSSTTFFIYIFHDVTEAKQEMLQKKLLHEIGELFYQEAPLPALLKKMMIHFVNLGKFNLAEIWLVNTGTSELNLKAYSSSNDATLKFYDDSTKSFKLGEGLPGNVWKTKKEEIWDNIDARKDFIRKSAAEKLGLKSALGLPLINDDQVIGVLVFFSDNAASSLEHYKDFFKNIKVALGLELKRKLLEEDLKQLVEYSPDILCIAGSEGKFIRVNPAFCRLLEYTEEELTTCPFTTFLHPDDRISTETEYGETISNSRRANGFVNRYLTKSGKTKWISWDSSEISSQDGSNFAYGRDITEQKELEDLLDNATRLARIGGWEIDLTNDTVYWSPITYEIHEADKNFVPTIKNVYKFYTDEFQSTVLDKIEKAIAKKIPWEYEALITTKKGNDCWVKVVGQAKFKDNKYVGSYGSIQDIHQRKSTELLLSSTADNIPGAIFQYMIRPDGTDAILQLTKGAYDLWNLSPEECMTDISLIWNQTKGGGDYDIVAETIGKSAETLEDWYCQYRSKLPNGKIIWHEGYGKPQKLKDGSILWDSLIIDITAQKQNQLELEKSVKTIEDYKFALDQSAIVAITNKKGEILSVNDNFCTISKFDRSELIGKTHKLINSGFHEREFFVHLWKTIARGNVWRGEIKNKAKDGSYYWVDTTIVPFLDKKNKPFQYLAIRFDVTSRKLADEEIQRSNERFQKVAEATHDAIWDWDIANDTLYRGSGFKELFGYDVKTKIESSNFWKDKFHPDDLPDIIQSLEAAIKDPTISNWSHEYRILQKNETIVSVVDRGVIIRNEKGTAIRMVGAITNITHRKEYEESLMQLNFSLTERAKELAVSNAELEQFAFVASHDLQEPLRMVTSFLTQLEKKYADSLDDKAKQYIHFAVDGAKRMREIILNLLDFSQVGKHKDSLEAISLEKVVQETLNMQSQLILERKAKITFKNLPTVYSYHSPLLQIFQNLIGNGIKYSKENLAPVIRVSAKELDNAWEISIQDNGIGIDPEYHDKIFVLFQRLHHKEEYSGTGIGLAVVKKIIESLGGDIWLESQPDNGSIFYFTLPKTNRL